MRNHVRVAVGTAAAGALLLLSPASAFADTVCDPYSHVCTQTGGGQGVGGQGGTTGGGQGGTTAGGQGGTTGTTVTNGIGALPFTGAEIVLMTLIGGGAVVGGTALVMATRRRRGPTLA